MRNKNHKLINASAGCNCHPSQLKINGPLLTRYFCHCSICQSLYKAPYSDFVVINAKHVKVEDESKLVFAKYRYPPALNRGLCTHCNEPVIGFLSLFPSLKLAFIPSHSISGTDCIIPPEGHLFCGNSTAKVTDPLPKYSGYWKSELAISKSILKALII